jgi:glycogen(starch) synthase
MEQQDKYGPLRIMMTADTVGGVWSYAMELCRALEPLNVHFYLVTTGRPLQSWHRADLAALKQVTLFETDFTLEWMDSPWKNIDSSGEWLLRLADELQPNLVHLNEYSYAGLPWKAPVLVVAHSDVFSWWLAVKRCYPPAEWNEYFRRVFRGLQQADYIIAPSKAVMKQIRKIYYATAPGQVIYNTRSSSMFSPGQKNAVICSVGRIWDEAKNINLLVKAAPLIPYEIRLAGETSFQNDGLQVAAKNITCLGRLPAHEIAAELAAAAVYVLPATYEPFGLSVLEAALSGCALVLGKISSLKEIWGESAIYVDTANETKLAQVVNGLMEDEVLRLRYSRLAYARAQKFTMQAMTAGYLEVYQQLVHSEHELVNNK